MFIKARLIILSLLVTIAVSVIAAASSSAFEYQVGGAAVPPAGVELLGNGVVLTAEVEVTIAMKKIVITCMQSTYVGAMSKIEEKGASKGTIEFVACTANLNEGNGRALAECRVQSFPYAYTGQLEKATGVVGLKPAKKLGAYAVIEIEKVNAGVVCEIEGAFVLSSEKEGVEICTYPTPGAPRPGHAMLCTGGGSKQELNGQEAKVLFLELNTLAGNVNWTIM